MVTDNLKAEAIRRGIPFEKFGRQLVWFDEFDGDKLDMTKWYFTRTMYGADCEYDNGEKYVRVEDNKLHMQVHKSDLPDKSYALCQGLTTMKTNTPFAKADYMAEIDIFEVFSSPNAVVSNLHKWASGGRHVMLPGGEGSLTRAYEFEKYENLNDEYHTYGFEWDEHFMTFYVDDVKYTAFPIDESGEFGEHSIKGMAGFHDFAYIIFNNEIFTMGRSWKPEGKILTDEDEMPIDYYIDYVRFYQNSEKEEVKFAKEIEAELEKSEEK